MLKISSLVTACGFIVASPEIVIAKCDTSSGIRGINIEQSSCKNWVDDKIPPAGEFYASLLFDFQLLVPPKSSTEATWFELLKTQFSDSDVEEILVSIVPKLGDYNGIEIPVYTFNADKKSRTFDTTGRFAFSTPLIRYDHQPLGFTIKLRAGSKASHDVGGVLDSIQPMIGAARPDTWILSEAAKPVIEAVAGVTDNVLDVIYTHSDADEAEFEMAGDTTDGVMERTIQIKVGGASSDPLGQLTVKVKMKRSLLGSQAVLPPAPLEGSVVAYPDSSKILGFQLPSVDSARKTVLSGLSSEDDDVKAISAILFDSNKGLDLASACNTLRASADTKFGFNDVDSVRMLYELLQGGNRLDALIAGSRRCLNKSDWKLVEQHDVFEAESDAGGMPTTDGINLFGTGLRKGMDKNEMYALQLADNLEEVSDGSELLAQTCLGFDLGRKAVEECLNAIKANRFKLEDRFPGRTSLMFTTRAQVATAIATLKAKRSETSPEVQLKSNLELAQDLDFAKEAAILVPWVSRVTMFYNGDSRIKRLKFEKVDAGEAGKSALRQVGLSCWAKDSDVQAPCIESGIAYPN